MSDNKIKTLYLCPICCNSYGEKESAEACLRSHESEIICRQLELGHMLGCTRYGFSSYVYRQNADYKPNAKVDTFTLNDYPKFATECLDNDADILAAKKRLIEAAHKWTEKYNEVLTGLERELEKKND